MPIDEQRTHELFIKALQHEPIHCGKTGCAGPVDTVDLSQTRDRVKMFEARCQRCEWHIRIGGREQLTPPWDDATLLMMADEHLMHQQPACPFDKTPVVFISMPNPRRKAKYRVACFYCGRQTEMDWPPAEAKR